MCEGAGVRLDLGGADAPGYSAAVQRKADRLLRTPEAVLPSPTHPGSRWWVQGSQGERYEVTAVTRAVYGQVAHVLLTCTCPHGENSPLAHCSHAAAVATLLDDGLVQRDGVWVIG